MNENLAVGINQLPAAAATKRQELLADKDNVLAGSAVLQSSKSTTSSVDKSGACVAASTSVETDIDCIGSAVKHLILESNIDSDDIGNRVKVGGKHVFIRVDKDCWHPLRSVLSKTRTEAHPSKSTDKSRQEPVVIFAGQIHTNISRDLCTKKGIPFQVVCSLHTSMHGMCHHLISRFCDQVWEKIINRLYAVTVLQPTHMRVAEPLENPRISKQEAKSKDEYPTSSTTFNLRTSQLKAVARF